jgi:hypothetical protein
VTGDDDRRAEIEAVADILAWEYGLSERPSRRILEAAAKCIAALDRVRDARGDDETDRLANDLAGDWRDCLPMRRPEQPPPDALGGQPPAEPENP